MPTENESKRNYLISLLNSKDRFNPEQLADYLIQNGIEVHFMKDFSVCWRVEAYNNCQAPASYSLSDDCYDCESCKHKETKWRVRSSRYDSHFDDLHFGKEVFRTEKEAGNQLSKILKELSNFTEKV